MLKRKRYLRTPAILQKPILIQFWTASLKELLAKTHWVLDTKCSGALLTLKTCLPFCATAVVPGWWWTGKVNPQKDRFLFLQQQMQNNQTNREEWLLPPLIPSKACRLSSSHLVSIGMWQWHLGNVRPSCVYWKWLIHAVVFRNVESEAQQVILMGTRTSLHQVTLSMQCSLTEFT